MIDDRGDTETDTLWLKETTITVVDMPSVPEVFLLDIQAETGSYQLSLDGGNSQASLNWNSSESEMASAISLLTGEPLANIQVSMTIGSLGDSIKQ